MMKKGFLYSFILLLFGMSVSAYGENRLMDVKYQDQLVHQFVLELTFEAPLSSGPKTRLHTDPAQIILSFDNSVSNLIKNKLLIGRMGVESIQTAERGNTLDVIIDLYKIQAYEEKLEGNRYQLTINDEQMAVNKSRSFINKIEKIDFKRTDSGGGEIDIYFRETHIAANLQQLGTQLELQLYNTDISSDLLYTLDVQDFATPVMNFETFKDANMTSFSIKVSGDYRYRSEQEGRLLKIIIDKDLHQGMGSEPKKYTGRTLSLNFQNISVNKVLQIIADYNKFNLVTTDTVKGDITLHLDDVPWDQALDLILQSKGLDKRIEGNILLVAPSEEIALRESQMLKNKQNIIQLSTLYSEYIQINYAKASDIATLLKSDTSSLLSPRGSVAVDERTNTLLIKDTEDSLDNIHRLVEVLDIPIKQVLIESRVVTVRDNVSEDLGIRWGITDEQGDFGTSGTIAGAEKITNGEVPPIAERLNVNLPANPIGLNPTSIAFHVAKLTDGTILDLELTALEQEDKAEIISSPRLITANQKAAYIEQGVEIPYEESTSSGATSVTYKKAVLSLSVTPQITPDNRVILDLAITNDTPSFDTEGGLTIDTQRISTQVLVNHGETIVLGGIYQKSMINSSSRVPILGDIPYLGFFFRNSSKSNERRELLIFVTPKIISE
ncbi:type IV pilus secretin PilQ [Shewanella surugensis]|uniref:Type IV pilus secretin PilQ family protein n=1 Tax=Shewanella surugensis TaxID=212020 RepID=A0ABT0LD04_9GAMM|nr:type IV pilus secretin PilQ family protein [Shewanella surugensis]MCL1125563.1 type IV pilus secretin PilQ family protein [Shewanella surugensis]